MELSVDLEEYNLVEIIELFKGNEEGNNNGISEESKKILNQKLTCLEKDIFLLLKILSLNSIDNKEISLNTHINVALYLLNLVTTKINKDINKYKIVYFLQNIIKMISIKINDNVNKILYDDKIFIIFEDIFKLCFNNTLFEEDLLEDILDNIIISKLDDFPIIAKYYINFSFLIFKEKMNKNRNNYSYFERFYKPIVNIIFQKIRSYIDEKKNIYNNDFIYTIKIVFEFLFAFISNFRFDQISKKKEIILSIFENGKYIYQLIQICPEFDKTISKLYGNENHIIIFNEEISLMKFNIFQFLIAALQVLSVEKIQEDGEIEKYIENVEIVELINKIINLVIIDFKDIINNKNKYDYIKKNDGLKEKENDSINKMMYILICLLIRYLSRQPFKNNLSFDIKEFILNIIFPLIITFKDEITFLENNPKEYNNYIKDISKTFCNHNLRTSACFLIKQLCKNNSELKSFILNFSIEMMNYILNEGKINNNFGEHNIYFKYIKDSYINQFDDMTKLDLSLIVILVLEESIKSSYFNNYLREVLVNNQEKLHLIKDPIIKIKICRIYYSYLNNNLFKEEEEIPEIIIKNFNEKAVNYLLDNIFQNEKDYKQALSNEASEVINDILVNKNDVSLYLYVCECIEKNISNFKDIIKVIDFNYFYLIENIINKIKILERNLIFEYINNLTIRFEKENSKEDQKDESFLNRYFSILNSFLTGINKINNQDKEEIKKFDKIISPVINIVKDLENYKLYNELIEFSTTYINCLNGINNANIMVLKKIGVIIENEKKLSLTCFNFITIFLSKIKRNIDDNEKIDRQNLFDEIFHIIEKVFSLAKTNDDEDNDDTLNTLILTFQLLSLNINLNESNIIFLINENINKIDDTLNSQNQIMAANICLGLIYYTDITLNILYNEDLLKSKINKFIALLSINVLMKLPELNIMLNKCLILGIYKLFINLKKIKSLKDNKYIKLILLKIIFNLIFKQKSEKINLLSYVTKKDIICNFVNDYDDNDEEEEDILFQIEDNDFHNRIELALSGNEDIINLDEFKLFSYFIKYLRKYDSEIYEFYINKDFKQDFRLIDDILSYRNVNIKYNDKEYIVGRKYLHLKRNN